MISAAVIDHRYKVGSSRCDDPDRVSAGGTLGTSAHVSAIVAPPAASRTAQRAIPTLPRFHDGHTDPHYPAGNPEFPTLAASFGAPQPALTRISPPFPGITRMSFFHGVKDQVSAKKRRCPDKKEAGTSQGVEIPWVATNSWLKTPKILRFPTPKCLISRLLRDFLPKILFFSRPVLA